MRRTLATSWLLSGLLALTGSAFAQTDTTTTTKTDMDATGTMTTTTTQTTSTAAGEEGADMSGRVGTHHTTVTREEVRTWTATFGDREYEVHPNTPSYEGSTGLFHNPTAYTVPKGRFTGALFRDNMDRDPGDIDFSIHGLAWGYGLTDRLELHGNIGLQNRVDVDAPSQLLFAGGFGPNAGYYNDLPFARSSWETGFGDIKFGVKYKFMDDYVYDNPFALAVRGWVKLPTADEQQGLGTGKPSFGADVMLSKGLGMADLHFLIGGQANGDPDGVDGFNPSLDDEIKLGVGLNLPACSWIQLQAELLHHKYISDSDFEQTNATDLVVGPVFWIKPGFFIRPALSWNVSFDDRGLDSGTKSWTGRHLAIGFHPGTACHEIAVPPPPPPPPAANAMPTAACEIERSTVMTGETVRVRATASDPDGDSLSYSWSASAGRITGTGSEATLDTTGVAAPATITVTLRVSDGRGGTAESNCSVRIPAAERKAETTTCTSSGFPRNMARLNNVDKACLDDVASRLRTDPRARVVIIGYADTSERTPDVIARKRGEAVKAYLVKERGVDESRIVVRSGAATKPVDTGKDASARARNRRVDVIFVPEGATLPE